MKNLVDYSSSNESSDNEEIIQPVKSKKIKLQLPMLLDHSIKVEDRDDEPENHQMRIRSIPHIEGNWASHIHIDCKFHNTFRENYLLRLCSIEFFFR